MARGGPIPDLPPDRPKVPEAAELIRQIYASAGGGSGCCLHLVTDDHNLERHFVEWSAEYARERGHELCERTARMLAAMTRSQRDRAIDRASDMTLRDRRNGR